MRQKGKSLITKAGPDNNNSIIATPRTCSYQELSNNESQSRGSQLFGRQSTRSTFEQSNRFTHSLVSSELIQSLNTFDNFNERSPGVYISKQGDKVRKVFHFNADKMDVDSIKNAIDEVKQMRKRKPSIVDLKLLNSIPSERTKIYREINSFEGK